MKRHTKHILGLLFVLICPLSYGVVSYVKQRIPQFSERRLILHSSRADNGVVIPFRLENGLIKVGASFEGENMECILDTGCPTVLCPQQLMIEGTPTWCVATATDAGGNGVRVRQVVLGEMRLGGYELQSMPVFQVFENVRTSRSSKPKTIVRSNILLGDSAFSHVVLTIDYRHKELIIRSSDYDFRYREHNRDAVVLRISWADPLPDGHGVINIAGEVCGFPMHFLLDTAYTANMVGLASPAGKRIQTSHTVYSQKLSGNLNTGLGVTHGRFLRKIHWALYSASGKPFIPEPETLTAVLINNLGSASDAVIGTAFLKIIA